MVPSDDTTNGENSEFSFEELWARNQPPRMPLEAYEASPYLARLIRKLDPIKSLPLVAGLATLPEFQANFVRIDFVIRLLVSHGRGKRTITRSDLVRLINTELVKANVQWLEDPPEDFFSAFVPTVAGNFRLFTGIFEKAIAQTEAVFQAFSAFPNGNRRDGALRRVLTLMKLSDAVAERSGLGDRVLGSGHPTAALTLPSENKLRTLSKRVCFTLPDLEGLGIAIDDLRSFCLKPEESNSVSSFEAGDSNLDFLPLIETRAGIVVVAPYAISTAVRAFLIDCADTGGIGPALQYRLLLAQGRHIDESGFIRIDGIDVGVLANQPARDFATEISPGRYVHFLQTVDDFAGWPSRAFGSTTDCDPDFAAAVEQSIREAQSEYQARDGFRAGMTIWLAGGWGSSRAFTFQGLAKDWPVIVLEPEDAATLGLSENGSLEDIWRLVHLIDSVREQGFELVAANGILNTFQWWRDNDFDLIPPRSDDCTPPIVVNYATNLLLRPRTEGIIALDRRAIPHPSKGWVTGLRLERQSFTGPLEPIYASMSALRSRELLGASVSERKIWWIGISDPEEEHSTEKYETWNAALNWAQRLLPNFETTEAGIGTPTLLHFELSVEARREYLSPSPPTEDEIDAAIAVRWDPTEQVVRVDLSGRWQEGLHRSDNRAELALAAALMDGACQAAGIRCVRTDLVAIALEAAGSPDFRFRHSLEVHRVVDAVRSLNLTPQFHPLSKSASALIKCGSVWNFRQREDGVRIEGKAECIAFLNKLAESELSALLAAARSFDRVALVETALHSLQAALGDQRNWDTTARALRAIHGVDGDFNVSLEHRNLANGVIRASSLLAEIAACESPSDGGGLVGQMDLEELQARVLGVFVAGDTLPGLYADRIRPLVLVSPTGEMLYDQSFQRTTVRVSAERRHGAERARSSDEYLTRFDKSESKLDLSDEFLAAVQAEYGVPHSTLKEFPMATFDVARKRGAGVLILRRSELLAELASFKEYRDLHFAPLLDRLTLARRNGWSTAVPGAVRADFDLAKFDRRFSMIGRPVITLSDDADPLLAIAPAAIERCLVHNLSGAMAGGLQNLFWSSDQMKSFASACGGREGLEFNEEVARELKFLGLRTWPSEKPSSCLNLKKTPEVVALGDIDVLAITENGTCAWVVEAKDLKLCRTAGETAARLNDYRGKVDQKGRPDALLKHMRRVEFVRANASLLKKRLGLSVEPKVHGIVIVKAPQPMAQLQIEYSADATTAMLEDVAQIPWGTGW